MNAKGETLRLSPVWEVLPPGSSLGSSCMETLGTDPRTARPFGLGGRPLATVLWRKLRHLGVEVVALPHQERLRTGPGATDECG